MPGKKRNHSSIGAPGALNSVDDFDESEIRDELLSLLKNGMLLSELHANLKDKYAEITKEYVHDLLIDMEDVVSYTVPPRRCGTVASNNEIVYKLIATDQTQQEGTRLLVECIPPNTPYGEMLQRLSERFAKLKE